MAPAPRADFRRPTSRRPGDRDWLPSTPMREVLPANTCIASRMPAKCRIAMWMVEAGAATMRRARGSRTLLTGGREGAEFGTGAQGSRRRHGHAPCPAGLNPFARRDAHHNPLLRLPRQHRALDRADDPAQSPHPLLLSGCPVGLLPNAREGETRLPGAAPGARGSSRPSSRRAPARRRSPRAPPDRAAPRRASPPAPASPRDRARPRR